MKCVYCNESVNVESNTTYRQVGGWTKNRKTGTGGSNTIALRLELGRYAHAECVNEKKRSRRYAGV